jgi:hypothetical protein
MTTTELTAFQTDAIRYRFAADATELRTIEDLTVEGIVIYPLERQLREYGPENYNWIEDPAGALDGTVYVVDVDGVGFAVTRHGEIV